MTWAPVELHSGLAHQLKNGFDNLLQLSIGQWSMGVCIASIGPFVRHTCYSFPACPQRAPYFLRMTLNSFHERTTVRLQKLSSSDYANRTSSRALSTAEAASEHTIGADLVCKLLGNHRAADHRLHVLGQPCSCNAFIVSRMFLHCCRKKG